MWDTSPSCPVKTNKSCVSSSVIAIQYVHKLFHALLLLLLCLAHAVPLKVCKCANWKQSSAVKSNTVGSLVSWHDGLWVAQLSRKEGHSFGKWHAPGWKTACKSGCFSYSGGTKAEGRPRGSALCLAAASLLSLIHINSSLWHGRMILRGPGALIRHATCGHPRFRGR